MTIYCFGDSWAYGSELNQPQVVEHPFVHWFAQHIKSNYINYGQEGASLGIILHTLVSNITKISQNDIVLVIVPPDVRWYDENKEKGFYTLMQWQADDYMKFLNNKTVEWFKYHHLLFIYSIQQILNGIGCQYIMAHNYGQLPDITKYQFDINFDKFLSKIDLTNLLSEKKDNWQSYQLSADGPMHAHLWHGKYFEGNVDHPNELGHKRIAELMIEYYYATK
jgi:hypothetical protein